MGHLRLGRLPKTRRWVDVVQLLDTAPEDTSAIASAVVFAAEGRLKKLGSDASLGYCFWLLTRISEASRQPDFSQALSLIGIEVKADTSVLAFISQVTDQVQDKLSRNTSSGHFAELSSLAMRRALAETVGLHGGSLFGSKVDALQQSFLAYSKPFGFAHISHKFFADFFARTIRALVDRELSQHVGQGKSYANVHSSAAFTAALDLHARESARIMETFAADWYSLHNWESKGEISLSEAQAFVSVALGKLRKEFKLGAAGK